MFFPFFSQASLSNESDIYPPSASVSSSEFATSNLLLKIKGIRGYEHNPESAAFNSTLNSNLNSEIAKVVEYLSVLARTVKALQSNQLNFNISVSGLIDYFQRIYSTTTKVKKISD